MDHHDTSFPALADLVFLCCILAFALLAVHGSTLLSANGCRIDSDLATYAQGMAGERHPDLFENDPVLGRQSPANSIWNIERTIADRLAPDDNVAVGLLRAGGVAIVLYCLLWYALGRFLFRRSAFAALLCCLSCITVWVGWGTFWGILHSDPVPRVFYSAVFPCLLILAVCAYDRKGLRPFVLFCTGLSIWLHGVSALNVGVMIFLAFLFHRPEGVSFRAHMGTMVCSGVLFLIPVLLFLYPSLFQDRQFTRDELAVFQELFRIRWQEDYGSRLQTLLSLVSPSNPAAYILYAGTVATAVCMVHPHPRVRILARMMPFFVLGIILMALFSIFETSYAAEIGRLPMGHELIRGVKFLVPLSWIMICGMLVLVLEHLPQVCTPALLMTVVVLLLLVSRDRQYVAVQYSLSEMLGRPLPLTQTGDAFRKDSESAREVLERIREIVPEGDTVFCIEDHMMAIRYHALRPLAYLFKDGYVHFYNKDLAGTRKWLHFHSFTQNEYITDELRKLGIHWLLIQKDRNFHAVQNLRRVFENNRYILFAVGT